MSQRFYAYMWLREDGTPYYAGKGTGRRAWHFKHTMNRPKNRSRILIFNRSSEAEAFETEKELIRNWGRKDNGTGILRNFTDGGEGTSGQKCSDEQRIALSKIKTGKPVNFSETHRAFLADICRERNKKPMNQETRNKIADARRGTHHKMPEEAKIRISIAKVGNQCGKGVVWSDERRFKASMRMIGNNYGKRKASTQA